MSILICGRFLDFSFSVIVSLNFHELLSEFTFLKEIVKILSLNLQIVCKNIFKLAEKKEFFGPSSRLLPSLGARCAVEAEVIDNVHVCPENANCNVKNQAVATLDVTRPIQMSADQVTAC